MSTSEDDYTDGSDGETSERMLPGEDDFVDGSDGEVPERPTNHSPQKPTTCICADCEQHLEEAAQKIPAEREQADRDIQAGHNGLDDHDEIPQ